ncbi:MAG TPA: hypothetical protein VFB01_18925 [Burkholderiales bacterium]|nr:hypothetical protein [Burkholderiales bacterium]
MSCPLEIKDQGRRGAGWSAAAVGAPRDRAWMIAASAWFHARAATDRREL